MTTRTLPLGPVRWRRLLLLLLLLRLLLLLLRLRLLRLRWLCYSGCGGLDFV